MSLSNFYNSHTLDYLAEILCNKLVAKQDNPFAENIVISQSKTIKIYLNKHMADISNIAANTTYLYPRNSINFILEICGVESPNCGLDRDSMTWQIYQLLPEMGKEFPQIKNYCEFNDGDKYTRRYQLSKVIAGIFDNYMGYRADWLQLWQQGKSVTQNHLGEDLKLNEHEKWQAKLWRKLTIESVNKLSFFSPAELLKKNISNAENIKKLQKRLNNRISIFGISNLPADFINFFVILSEVIDVDFYYITPCVEYWGDTNKKEVALNGIGNPLLACWGELGRDFFNLLVEPFHNLIGGEDINIEKELKDKTILHGIQQDILLNLEPRESNLNKDFQPDDSLVISNCFSEMREVEVLKDQIINFLTEKNLKPSDIVVLTNDIEKYFPYIKAVFDSSIPFTIADCSSLQTSTIAETFLSIINLTNSRMTAKDIFEIISSERISEKFNLSADDLNDISEFITNANIAWGIDKQHRQQVSNNKQSEINTWKFGFNRLFSGYAFDYEEPVSTGELPLPLPCEKGTQLGKMKQITDMIFNYTQRLAQSISPNDWHKLLITIINDFFYIPSDKNENLQPIYDAIDSLHSIWIKTNTSEDLPSSVIISALKDILSDSSSGGANFFRGGITFCRLLPMRNIPFKAICIIGLNEGEFPKIDRTPGFDLSVKDSRRGDRSVRKDGRFIFLETIMAAREYLYLSYIGQSNITNESIPPSILISELLNYLSSTTKISEDKFITKHPLQSFNINYFNNSSNLFSYSNANLEAAKNIQTTSNTTKSFCPQPLVIPTTEEMTFSFNEFVKFFICPAQFFLNNRLGINLFIDSLAEFRNCEPFSISPMEKGCLKSFFLDNKFTKRFSNISKVSKLKGNIPSGIWGEETIEEIEEITSELYQSTINCLGKRKESKSSSIYFEIDKRQIKLQGEFNNLHSNGQGFYRAGKIRNKDKLMAWIWHQLINKAGFSTTTTIIGYNGKKIEGWIFDAFHEDNLENLIELFYAGGQKPLPLFEHTSANLCIEKQKFIKDEKEVDYQELISKVSKYWSGGYTEYERDINVMENKICFGDDSPIYNKKNFAEIEYSADCTYGKMIEEIEFCNL